MIVRALVTGLEGANEDGYVDLPEEQAKNLIKKGLAEPVNVHKTKTKVLPKAKYGNREFDRPLESMSEKRLKEIARELDIYIGRKRKETLVEDIIKHLTGGAK